MNTEDKAKELIEKFEESFSGLEVDSEPGGGGWVSSESSKEVAKECAIICVDEIINSYCLYKGMHDQEFINGDIKFYKEVKEKINQL